MTSGQELITLEGHTDSVKSLARMPGNRLASGSEDTTIRLWSIQANGIHNELILDEYRGSDVLGLCLLTDGVTLVSASADLSLRFWNMSSGSLIAKLKKHRGPVRALALLSDGRMVSASMDKSLIIWN